MSGNINIPIQKPLIQEAQNMLNNGGGGNLGYFQRENKKKKNSNSQEAIFEDVFDEYVSSSTQQKERDMVIDYGDSYVHEKQTVNDNNNDYIYKAKKLLKKINFLQNN